MNSIYNCEVCETEFTRKSRLHLYCSDECRKLVKKQTYEKNYISNIKKKHSLQCDVCGNRFEAMHKSAKYCSDICRNKRQKEKLGGFIPHNSICDFCGKEYLKKRANQKHCSDKCSNDYWHSISTYVPTKGYSKETIEKHQLGKNIECKTCKKLFIKKDPGVLYCSEKCSYDFSNGIGSFEKRFNHGEANCDRCGKSFIKKTFNTIYCSEECRKISNKEKGRKIREKYKKTKEEEKAKKDKFLKSQEGKYVTKYANLRFTSEQEFEHWFEENYTLFGIRRLLKIDTFFPDVVAELFNRKVVRIELELIANNFMNHNHNPEQCDLVICFLSNTKQTTVLGVPIISMFQTPFTNSKNNTDYDVTKLKMTPFFRNLIDKITSNMEDFIEGNKINYPDEIDIEVAINKRGLNFTKIK